MGLSVEIAGNPGMHFMHSKTQAKSPETRAFFILSIYKNDK
jgi:hypothetical protein